MNLNSSLTSKLHIAALQLFISVNGSVTEEPNASVLREAVRHSRRVALLSYVIAREMKNTNPRHRTAGDISPRRLAIAALFHDVGKAGVSARILGKTAALDEAEYSAIKAHPAIGAHLIDQIAQDLSKSGLLEILRDVVLYHHERWDGTGYPAQLSGESIPLAARVVAVADAYDAIRFTRIYKLPRAKIEAVQAIIDGAGTQFDPKMARLLVSVVTHHRVGDAA